VEVARRTRAHELHSGLSTALPYGSKQHGRFEEEVRKMARQVSRAPRSRTTWESSV
jgi:hypothetical protein